MTATGKTPRGLARHRAGVYLWAGFGGTAMKFLVVSCSLSELSRSREVARRSEQLLLDAGQTVSFLDLRGNALPFFDNGSIFQHPSYLTAHKLLEAADGIILASPVYNWGLCSAAKNLIEATGATGEGGRRAAWFDKVVTFVCCGGLPHSYMAYGSTALALMLDFKCVINPYVVYATDRDVSDDGSLGSVLAARLAKTVRVKIELCEALKQRNYRSDWEV